MHRKITLSFVAVLSLVISLSAAPIHYHLVKQVTLGGEGGWDYLTVDPATHRIFVSHATHVLVLDGSSGAQLGDIPDTPGVHGIAVADDLSKGFISNGRGNSITIFDLKTLKATGQVPAGENPDAIMYDLASHRVFAFNGRSKNATVVDAKSGQIAATIPLPGKPEFAVADGKGHVYVNIEDKNSIVAIDSRSLKPTATWELPGCESPSGLAIDQAHRRLFSVCDGKVMAVTDADSGKQVAKVEIGEGPDAARFDPKTQLAFSPNGGDGTLTVVHEDSPDRYTVVQSVTTQRGARTMELDPDNGKVYLVTAKFGERPAATSENPRPRPPVVPDSFTLLMFEK
jgi:DNA-binding beta-propeller fold protein YncE